MKVLFLDVDGVLNMEASGGLKTLNRNRLKLLEEIINTSGCKIVVSSSWRKDAAYLNRLHRVLNYRGISVHGVTPILDQKRGYEIKSWLEKHNEVTHYAIVDDNNDMLESQQSYFVQTDSNIGLTKDVVDKIIHILI